MITIPKKLWLGAIVLIASVTMFIFGYFTRGWLEANTKFYVASVQSPNEVTSSITDRWELQLTDRTNGQVRIYDKDVLDALYYQYAARRSYTQEDRKPQ